MKTENKISWNELLNLMRGNIFKLKDSPEFHSFNDSYPDCIPLSWHNGCFDYETELSFGATVDNLDTGSDEDIMFDTPFIPISDGIVTVYNTMGEPEEITFCIGIKQFNK